MHEVLMMMLVGKYRDPEVYTNYFTLPKPWYASVFSVIQKAWVGLVSV